MKKPYTFASRIPDVIIMDLLLPDMTGVEVRKRLREHAAGPIIVLSAIEDETQTVIALEMGADDYVTKSFGIEELLARFTSVLRRAAARTVCSLFHSRPPLRQFRSA